ncbi:MAG: hypothetical protein PUF51_07620 [Bifidobacteriaceae bacterium]|nr:hypothetical protein [Bifidobacteriaceae bacterium]
MRQFRLDPTDFTSQLRVDMAVGALVSALASWYRHDKPVSAERLAQLFQNMMEHGLLG